MILCLFVAYATSDVIGSPGRMYELLTEAAAMHPVAGNEAGSYITMKSENGAYIGLIFIGAGFAAAVDAQLFQKAIAADPAGTLPGYILGGLCWFTIPFVLASTFGLAAAATEHLPVFPTYPNRMTEAQLTSGLAMPFGAIAIMGNGGAIAVMIMMFMAVTSAMSSETVATVGLVTYDIYKAYINRDATNLQLVRVSQITVLVFGFSVAGIAVGFNHAGFSVNYLVTAIGIFVDSAIVPMACTILWKKQSLAAVVLSPIISSLAAIIAWLLTAYKQYGEVTITTTSQNLPLVAGNMMSLCGPLLLSPLITYLKPANYNWELLKEIKSDRETPGDLVSAAPVIMGLAPGEQEVSSPVTESATSVHDDALDTKLRRARNKACLISVTLCLCFLLLWPIPMYGTGYVFSRQFFTGWVVIVFLWAFFAAITITFYPVIESWGSLIRFSKFISGGSRRPRPNPNEVYEVTTDTKTVPTGTEEQKSKEK